MSSRGANVAVRPHHLCLPHSSCLPNDKGSRDSLGTECGIYVLATPHPCRAGLSSPLVREANRVQGDCPGSRPAPPATWIYTLKTFWQHASIVSGWAGHLYLGHFPFLGHSSNTHLLNTCPTENSVLGAENAVQSRRGGKGAPSQETYLQRR